LILLKFNFKVNQILIIIKNLFFASNELKNKKDIVLIAVKKNGFALKYASNDLKDNIDIINVSVKNNYHSICYASNIIKNYKN